MEELLRMKELFRSVEELDADQFESLLWHMNRVAEKTAAEFGDTAWGSVREYLGKAAEAVSERTGN